MDDYEPEAYWSGVGEAIRQRGAGNVIAGDDSPFFRYQRREFLRQFLGTTDVQNKVILEVGCGPGGNLKYLAGRNPQKVIGVDISQTMVDIAANTVKDCANVELHKTNGAAIPLPDRFVDVALTVTVLQHNIDEETFNRLIGEICRVTRGLIVLSEMVGTGRISGNGSFIGRPMRTYEMALEKRGFRLQRSNRLEVALSRRVYKRLAGLLARGHKEGDRFPLAARLAFNAALPVTRMLDPVLSPYLSKRGVQQLTRMEFSRA